MLRLPENFAAKTLEYSEDRDLLAHIGHRDSYCRPFRLKVSLYYLGQFMSDSTVVPVAINAANDAARDDTYDDNPDAFHHTDATNA